MNLHRRFCMWVAVGVAALLGVVWEAYPLADATARLALLGRTTMGFEGTDVPLTPAESEVFGGATVLKRLYHRGNICFVLLVVDGTANRHGVHDPMYCFRGAGWEVAGKAPLAVPGGEAQWVRLRRGGQEQEVLYWFSNGRTRHASVVRYWLQATARRLTLGKMGEEPVLVQVLPCGGVPLEWLEILERFVPLQEI